MHRLRPTSLLLVLLALMVGAGCGGDDPEPPGGGQAQGEQAQREPPPAAEPAATCRRVEAPTPKRDGGERRPRRALDPDRTYRLTFVTSCGDFTVELDLESAPRTAASLASLARADFFDDTTFHRIVPGFVIQGGDPTATGQGGPGYSTRDRPSANARYTRGVVAMAKTEQEAPGTAGSQFFVVTGADVGLPPDYAVVGEVTEGLEVVDRIGALGDAAEQPTQPVVIEDVRVSQG